MTEVKIKITGQKRAKKEHIRFSGLYSCQFFWKEHVGLCITAFFDKEMVAVPLEGPYLGYVLRVKPDEIVTAYARY